MTRLANGLRIVMHPRTDFHKTYAVFGTDYGSIDLTFTPIGSEQWVTSPQGVAHFLEHKLFEKKSGDVMDIYAQNGAQVNAFTTYTQTAYYFSGTDLFKDNLNLLLNFVQTPYFTEKLVEKEKPIIAQEILMYDDAPEWKVQEILLQCLYPEHPIRYDIAGTVASIQDIDSQTLYQCYETFYHPQNMTLIISGNFDASQTLDWIMANQSQKEFVPFTGIKRYFPQENLSHIQFEQSMTMDINSPQILLGVRGDKHHLKGREALKYQITMSLALEMLFGPTSSHYEQWYLENLIDYSFGYSYHFDRSYDYLSVGSQTEKPEYLTENIRRVLLSAAGDENMTSEHLATVLRRIKGKFIKSLNSLEFIALSFLKQSEAGATVFDQLDLMQEITLDEIRSTIDSYVNEDLMSCATILPQK